MKIQCQLEPQDYLKAQFLHMRPRPVLKWIGLFLVALGIFIGLQQIFVPPPSGRTLFVPCAIFGGLGYFAFFYGVWLPLRSKKIFEQQKTLREAYDAEITSDGLSTSSSFGSSNIKWEDFHKYKVGKILILVYQSDAIFHMFPKRWFSDQEFAEFQNYLREALGEPKI